MRAKTGTNCCKGSELESAGLTCLAERRYGAASARRAQKVAQPRGGPEGIHKLRGFGISRRTANSIRQYGSRATVPGLPPISQRTLSISLLARVF